MLFPLQIICDDTINTETFERSIYIGLVFCSMYLIVGFLVDFIGKKIILIVVLGITGLCGIGAHLAQNQIVAVVLFAVFQMSGACIGLMNAVAVGLFPTKYRCLSNNSFFIFVPNKFYWNISFFITHFGQRNYTAVIKCVIVVSYHS